MARKGKNDSFTLLTYWCLEWEKFQNNTDRKVKTRVFCLALQKKFKWEKYVLVSNFKNKTKLRIWFYGLVKNQERKVWKEKKKW